MNINKKSSSLWFQVLSFLFYFSGSVGGEGGEVLELTRDVQVLFFIYKCLLSSFCLFVFFLNLHLPDPQTLSSPSSRPGSLLTPQTRSVSTPFGLSSHEGPLLQCVLSILVKGRRYTETLPTSTLKRCVGVSPTYSTKVVVGECVHASVCASVCTRVRVCAQSVTPIHIKTTTTS